MSVELQPAVQAEEPARVRPLVIPSNERLSLMDVWRVLMKHRFVILLVSILCIAAAVFYAFRTKPVYQSVSRIEIKPSTSQAVKILGLSSTSGDSGQESTALQTEARVLQSDSTLFQTAVSLDLISAVRNSGKKTSDKPARSSSDVTSYERSALIGMIKNGLTVSIIQSTDIIEIRYRNEDPKLAAAVVNKLVETYSDQDLRSKYERTMHVSKWLEGQLDDISRDATDAQRDLADYQRQHNIVGTDENSNLTIQTLQQVSSDLDSAEADRILKESRMRQFEALKPDMVALMGDNPALASLRGQLTDLESRRVQLASKVGAKHPQLQEINVQITKVKEQIDNEVEAAREQVRNEYQGSLNVERAIRKRLTAQEEDAYRLNEDVAQYAILRHKAELTRDLYDTLQMRLKEASITAGLTAANITVIDPAQVPFIPVAPQKVMSLMLGSLGGLLGGCMLAFLIESIDDRLQTSEEVETASMLPSLATIPHIVTEEVKGKVRRSDGMSTELPKRLLRLNALWDPKSNSAESFRGLRSSILLSSVDKPPQVIVFTSAFPGEGKTTTAANCAVVLAQRGERVLLVDADLRRGTLRRAFGLDDNEFGLSNVLSHRGVHQKFSVPLPELPTLYVLPTGPRPPNPAEMLSSNRMGEQLREWRKEFDRIVIDSAPLLAVSDTTALAVLADSVILVSRAGMTRKRALIRARDLLWRINAPIAGVVVNDVDMRLENFYTYRYGMYGYNYGYKYRYGAPNSDRAYGYEDDQQGE
jgi:succinoglycan biosynthesis transport protein ExoP